MRERDTRKTGVNPTYIQDKDTGFTFEVIHDMANSSMSGKRSSTVGKYLVSAFIVVFFIITIAFIQTMFYGGDKIKNDVKTILIPEVIDMERTSAIHTLESLGLVVEIENTLDDSREIDTIVSQSIEPRVEVIVGTKIILRSVIHTAKVFMPDLRGLTSEAAVDILKKLDHEFIIQEILDQSTIEGYVIDSLPSSGTEIKPGELLTIQVSLGKSEYSQWTAVLPQSVTTSYYIIESRTQYRYRQKQVETSTILGTHETWELIETKIEYSNWSAWSEMEIKPSDLLEVEMKNVVGSMTLYEYKRYTYVDKNSNEIVHTWQEVNDENVKEGSGKWEVLLDNKSRLDVISTFCSDSNEDVPCGNSTLIKQYSEEWFSEKETIKPDPENNHMEYRSREIQKYYTFVLYSEWSTWSDVKVNSAPTREVETRTIYRYKSR